jgi:hypothetical protein
VKRSGSELRDHVIELTLNGLEPLKFRLLAYPSFVSPAPDDGTKAFQSSLPASSDMLFMCLCRPQKLHPGTLTASRCFQHVLVMQPAENRRRDPMADQKPMTMRGFRNRLCRLSFATMAFGKESLTLVVSGYSIVTRLFG